MKHPAKSLTKRRKWLRHCVPIAVCATAGCAGPSMATQAGATAAETEPAKSTSGGRPDALTLERSFPGPFEGTSIYRLRDTERDVTCYLFVPDQVRFSRDGDRIDYGASSIGSISCVK